MRKIKNYFKTGILLLGILISMTNCEKEEFSIDSPQTTIDEKSLYDVPNTQSVKENFQNLNNFRNPFVSSVLIAKEEDNKFFIDWNNSKSVNFKKKENINILYTPIIYNKKGKRNKSFIASIANKNNEIESFIFSVFYDRLATDEIFSGYISKFDSSGRAIELYKYENGLLKTTYTFKKEKNSSKKGYSNRDGYDDCGGTTMEDILFIMDYLLEYGETGETIYFGDCVYITSSGGGGGDNSWSNPDMNLSGGFIPLGENYNYTAGGGGSSTTTSTTSTDVLIAPEGLQWWAEDFGISPTSYLINNIQNITNEQIQWINDPRNLNVVNQLITYINVYGNSSETILMLEAIMNGIPVIFDIEKANIYQGNPLNFQTLTPEQKVAVVIYAIKKAVSDNSIAYFDIHKLFYNLPSVDVDIVAKIPIGGKLLDVRIIIMILPNLQINEFPNSGDQYGPLSGKIGNYIIEGYWWNLKYRSYNPSNNNSAEALFIQVKEKGQYNYENSRYFENFLGY